MIRTARPGLVLAAGLVVSAAAALSPAGLHGRVPAGSWALWAVVLVAGVGLCAVGRGGAGAAARTLAWLFPPILLMTIPAAWFAGADRGAVVAAALATRAMAAAAVGLGTVSYLGPSGTVAGLRALRVPSRFVAIVHAMLVSLAAIARQVGGMQRARAARRARATPWSALVKTPRKTLRAFGGLSGAVLLRAIERAESLERARIARGGGES